MSSATTTTTAPSKFQRFVSKYNEDHQHPVNHVLHVFVGWPMVGASILLLPFRPLWSPLFFFGGYAFMFSGHFLFEKNTPTVLKHPSIPFVMAWQVILQLTAGLRKMVLRGR